MTEFDRRKYRRVYVLLDKRGVIIHGIYKDHKDKLFKAPLVFTTKAEAINYRKENRVGLMPARARLYVEKVYPRQKVKETYLNPNIVEFAD